MFGAFDIKRLLAIKKIHTTMRMALIDMDAEGWSSGDIAVVRTFMAKVLRLLRRHHRL